MVEPILWPGSSANRALSVVAILVNVRDQVDGAVLQRLGGRFEVEHYRCEEAPRTTPVAVPAIPAAMPAVNYH